MNTNSHQSRNLFVGIASAFCLVLCGAEPRTDFGESKTSDDAAELRTVELAIEVFENSHTNLDWKVESGAFHDALSKVQAMK